MPQPTIAQDIANRVKQLLEPAFLPYPRPAKGGQSWLIRQQRIKKEGSEYYNYTLPVTAATARVDVVIETTLPQAKKYEPLNFIEISNNGTVDLNLTLPGNETLYVPAGTIKSISRKSFYQFSITNLDAANPTVANTVRVALRRLPKTIDDWAAENG